MIATSIQHVPVVEFETEEGAAASVPPDTEVMVAPFEDGAVLLRERTKGRIRSVQGRYSLTAQVQAVLPDGHAFGVTDLLAVLWEYTRVVMEHVIDTAEQAEGESAAQLLGGPSQFPSHSAPFTAVQTRPRLVATSTVGRR